MADVEEILARLNPSSPGTELTPASTGDVLSTATVAQVLALIEEDIGASLLAIRVADLWSYYPDLERQVVEEVMIRAHESGWRAHRPLRGMVTHMSRLAIFEHCIPGLCRECKGRGEKHPKGAPVRTCERCEGTGKFTQMSETERANEVGIDKRTWRRVWSARYTWIQRMLVGRDAVAVEQLRRLLRNG